MIRLTNIKATNIGFKCNGYFENISTPVELNFDVKDNNFVGLSLPKEIEYKYYRNHLFHAKQFLKSLVSAKDIPNSELLMWY